MNKLFKIILVVFVLLCGIPNNKVTASEYVSNFQRIPLIEESPPRVANWKNPPTIIVCDGAPISKYKINKAVKFWENLGHKFKEVQYKTDPLDKCNDPNPIGYILIYRVKPELKFTVDTMAQTHFYIDNATCELQYARIFFVLKVQEGILEHELGHALGFLHYNKTNHLMNDKWILGGWNTEGLRESQK